MALPAWLAVIGQRPALTNVTVVPLVLPVVQTLVSVEAKVTGLPEAPPVADRSTVPPDEKAWFASGVKLMTWVAWVMLNACCTSVAGL